MSNFGEDKSNKQKAKNTDLSMSFIATEKSSLQPHLHKYFQKMHKEISLYIRMI